MNLNQNIIFFDGVCNLCNKSVQFIIEHDDNAFFKFASLQSNTAQQILANFDENIELNTIILLKNNTIFKESDAAIEILKNLQWRWTFLRRLLKYVPPFLRNWVYRKIARHRYRWFGKKETCMIPTPEIKNRFLD